VLVEVHQVELAEPVERVEERQLRFGFTGLSGLAEVLD